MHYGVKSGTLYLTLCIATCNDGELKLVGGNTKYEGRLQICFDQRWTAIDAKGWTMLDTKVACKQLGYQSHGIMK